MSIWTKPIFGTNARPSTPASPVATRCAQMLGAAAIESMPLMFVGYIGGKALFMFALTMSAASVLAPTKVALVEWVSAFMKGLGVKPFLVAVGSLIFLMFVLPRLARWFLRRSNQATTVEARHKQRRMRRLTKMLDRWAFWILAALAAIGLAPAMGGRPLVFVAPFVGVGLTSWGMAMTLMALRDRSGVKLVCGVCDYPMGTWRLAPRQCPECGLDWKDPWNARLGVRRVNRRMLALGAASLTIAAAIIVVMRVALARMV